VQELGTAFGNRTQANNLRLEKNVFRFQITVYQPRLLEHRQRVQQLGSKHLHELCTQPLELILLDQFVKVGRQELEHQTQVTTVDE
jgi:hypothetical protein